MRKSFAAVLEGPFTKTLTAGIGKPDIMLLRRPIDANKPALCFLHVIVPAVISSLRDICRSLYWRSTAHSSHWASISRPPAGAHVPGRRSPEIQGAGPKRLLPAGSSIQEGCADSRAVTVLRSATLHFAQPQRCLRNRSKTVQGQFGHSVALNIGADLIEFCRRSGSPTRLSSVQLRQLPNRGRTQDGL